MRTAILISLALLGIVKGIGLAVAPDLMVQLSPLTAPAARVALCFITAVFGALLLYAAPAARAPRLVRGYGLYGLAFGLLSVLVPSEPWTAYVAFVHSIMLDQSAMAALASIFFASALLWVAGSPKPSA